MSDAPSRYVTPKQILAETGRSRSWVYLHARRAAGRGRRAKGRALTMLRSIWDSYLDNFTRGSPSPSPVTVTALRRAGASAAKSSSAGGSIPETRPGRGQGKRGR